MKDLKQISVIGLGLLGGSIILAVLRTFSRADNDLRRTSGGRDSGFAEATPDKEGQTVKHAIGIRINNPNRRQHKPFDKLRVNCEVYMSKCVDAWMSDKWVPHISF